MAERLIKKLIILLALMFVSCSNHERLFVISLDSSFLLPFKASEFFGFYEKYKVQVCLDSAQKREELIRLLNFSKYAAVIVDKEMASKIEELSTRWKAICVVGSRGSEQFVLLIKKGLTRKKNLVLTFIKGWNYGVNLLKDRAVLYYLTGKKELPEVRFQKCQGLQNEN